MIIILKNKTIKISSLTTLESLDNVLIKYQYELNTDHLLPQLTISDGVNKKIISGDRLHLDFTLYDKDIELTVDLLDTQQKIIRTYNGVIHKHLYCAFDTTTTLKDLNKQLDVLNAETSELNQKIIELKEKGDVI